MTANIAQPLPLEVAESDPAWEAFFRATAAQDELRITTRGGKSFRVIRDGQALWSPRPVNPSELPDFAARLRQLWPEGAGLTAKQSAQFDAWLSEDRPL